MKILIIEDNSDLADSINQYLTKEGYTCTLANNCNQAERKLSQQSFELIILDIMLPDGNGLDLLRRIKSKIDSNVGVLIVSAKNALDDKIAGLDLGADDYLTKPFHLSELNARLKAVLRRKNVNSQRTVVFHEIEIDTNNLEVTVCGNPLVLTRKEYDLLLFLVSNKNRVLTKQHIAEFLWGDQIDFLDSFDFVYQHIKNLRKKLSNAGASDYLQTVYGVGYKLKVG